MFEAAELGRKISKKEFNEAEAQRKLLKTDIPVIIIVSGVEGAGKGEVVNRLNKWLDARGISTVAFWDESDEETERPTYWRFWRNREKWDDYKAAINNMVMRTNTVYAPWTLIPGNNKLTARVEVLKTLCEHMEKALS